MQENTDYNSIRSIAYFIPSMILIMAIRVGVSAFMVHPGSGIANETLFRASGGLPLALQLVEYIISVACFVLLYRLADMNVWIDISNTMFLCYMLCSVAVRIVEWVAYKLDPAGVAEAAFLAAGEIPLIFILLGVVFWINGIREVYPKILEKTEVKQKKCTTARRLWILGMSLLIIAELLLEIFILHLNFPVTLPYRILSFVLAILFLISGIPVTLQTQSFCYSYYLYCYNQGR